MPFKSFRVTLSVIILLVELSTVVGRYSGRDYDHEEISNEEVKERLDILTNEVIQLKNDIQEVKGQTHGRQDEAQGMKKDTEEDLKILFVRRKPLADGNVRYTVRYQEPKIRRSQTLVHWSGAKKHKVSTLPESFSNRIPRLPPGIRETSVITSVPKEYSNLMLAICNYQNTIYLSINNTHNGEVEETDITTPILDISPKGDIVYDPGQNATVTIVYPLSSEDRGPAEADYFQRILAKPGDSNLIDWSDHKGIYHLENEIKYLDRKKQIVKIETANSSYSGIISFVSRIRYKNRLVKRIDNIKHVVLRPSTQKTAFPRGRIYHYNNFLSYNEKKNENGDILTFCNFGEACRKHCLFYGNNLKDLQLFKTVNGKTTRENFTLDDPRNVSYYRYGYFEITPALGDVSPVTYTCQVNNVDGQSLNYSHVLNFGERAKIMLNETRMERLGNDVVQLVCTARGYPLPKISIQCNDYDTVPTVLYQLDDVISVNGTCRDAKSGSWSMCSVSNEFQYDMYVYQDGNSSFPIEYGALAFVL